MDPTQDAHDASTATHPEHDTSHELAERIAEQLSGAHLRIAVAESLTSGLLATRLGAAPGSSDWFLGGVITYATSAKHDVLGVGTGPVISSAAAAEMAAAVARLFGANLSVSITGVGGPEEQNGEPVGTVFFGMQSPHQEVHVVKREFGGAPEDIVNAAVTSALRLLEARIHAILHDHHH